MSGGQPAAAGEARPEGSISLIACLAFAVGTMVGGGVFTLSGTAINEAVFGGLLIHVGRHQTRFGEDARRLAEDAIRVIDTPLARAMRGIEFIGRRPETSRHG